jgi:hypothetical protein
LFLGVLDMLRLIWNATSAVMEEGYHSDSGLGIIMAGGQTYRMEFPSIVINQRSGKSYKVKKWIC